MNNIRSATSPDAVNRHAWPVRADKARFALVDYYPYDPNPQFPFDGRLVAGVGLVRVDHGPDFAEYCPMSVCPDHGLQPQTGFHTTPGHDPTSFPVLACGGFDPEDF